MAAASAPSSPSRWHLDRAVAVATEALIDSHDEWRDLDHLGEARFFARKVIESLDLVQVGTRFTDDGRIEPIWRIRGVPV